MGPQAQVMWKKIERLCEKREPVAPSLRAMFDDPRATPAVLTFLRGHEGGNDDLAETSGGGGGGGGGGRGGRTGPATLEHEE